MITLHRISGEMFVLNAELIESLEETPDTVITLIDRRRVMVTETIQDVVDAVIAYRRLISNGVPVPALRLVETE